MNPFVRIRSSQSLAVGVVLTIVAALGLTVPALSAQATGSCDFTPSTYATLQSDFTSRASGSVICLGANLTGNASALDVPAGNTLTLNLNGFALTITSPAGQAAIGVPPTSTLTIDGPSDPNAPMLTVTGGPNSGASSAAGAGIGGDGGQSSGRIEIAGGRISATGGSTNGEPGSGAGIGGGGGGASGSVGTYANVLISGGEVSATGGAASGTNRTNGGSGAGIGGGGFGGPPFVIIGGGGGGGLFESGVRRAIWDLLPSTPPEEFAVTQTGGRITLAAGGTSGATGSGAGIGSGGIGGDVIPGVMVGLPVAILGGTIVEARGGVSLTGGSGTGIGNGGQNDRTTQMPSGRVKISGGAHVRALSFGGAAAIGPTRGPAAGGVTIGDATVEAANSTAWLQAPDSLDAVFLGWDVSNPQTQVAAVDGSNYSASTISFGSSSAIRTVSYRFTASISFENDQNLGAGTLPSASSYTTGDSAYSVPATWTGLTRAGYVFGGWTTAQGSTTRVANTITPSQNTVLYPIWQNCANSSYSTWATLKAAIEVPGAVGLFCLGTNLTPSLGEHLNLSASSNVQLDLSGHALTIDASGSAGEAGIGVPPGATFTVSDSSPSVSSLLDVTAAESSAGGSGAGIGGDSAQSAGTVKITGGVIAARGGAAANDGGSGAGIGGGGTQSGTAGSGGVFVLSGGTISLARGGAVGGYGSSGAGIGGGGSAQQNGPGGGGGSISISSGTITLAAGGAAGNGGGTGAGIGGGSGGRGSVGGSGGEINLTGGTVTATGGNSQSYGGAGAGIGGGGVYGRDGGPQGTGGTGGQISIRNATVTASHGTVGAQGVAGFGIGNGGPVVNAALPVIGEATITTGNTSFLLASAPVPTNATFVQWRVSNPDFLGQPADQVNIDMTRTKVISAILTATITFNPGAQGTTGSLPAASSFTTGGSAFPVPNSWTGLSRAGYEFGGWSATQGGGTQVQTLSPSENTVLYAIWTPQTFAITFNANGGTGTVPSPGNFTTGGSAFAPNQSWSGLAKTNFLFEGWGASNSSTTPVGALTPTSNTELFAIWRQALTIAFTPGVTPATGAPVSGNFSGLAAGTTWNLTAYSTPQQMGAGSVGQSGQLGFSTGLPSGLETGLHRVVIGVGSASYTTWFVVDRNLKILASSANPADLAYLQGLAALEVAATVISPAGLAATGPVVFWVTILAGLVLALGGAMRWRVSFIRGRRL